MSSPNRDDFNSSSFWMSFISFSWQFPWVLALSQWWIGVARWYIPVSFLNSWKSFQYFTIKYDIRGPEFLCCIWPYILYSRASLVAQMVKNMPVMQETWVQSLGWSPGGGHENPLQCSCLENPHGRRSLVGCSPWGHRVWHNWATECA